MSKPTYMPIMRTRIPGKHGYADDCFYPTPRHLPFSLFDAPRARRRAQANHGQTPERLAERGGLSSAEAVMVLGDLKASDNLRRFTGKAGVDALRDLTTPDPDGPVRASGDSRCQACGFLYREHPRDPLELDAEGEPFLRVLCGGRRVKL